MGSIFLHYEWVVFILQLCLKIIIMGACLVIFTLLDIREKCRSKILSVYQWAFLKFSLILGLFFRIYQLQISHIRRIARL